MKIKMHNRIELDGELEIFEEIYDADWMEKRDHCYLLFTNEEKEKVVLKFNSSELTMTRFSSPKSIMRFAVQQQLSAGIATPLGLQSFVTDTQLYRLSLDEQLLELHYQLKTADEGHPLASYQMRISWGEELC